MSCARWEVRLSERTICHCDKSSSSGFAWFEGQQVKKPQSAGSGPWGPSLSIRVTESDYTVCLNQAE